MRIDGYWLLCDDGVTRPAFRSAVLGADGNWHPVTFLADSGADRTALCADDLQTLGLSPQSTGGGLAGLGGSTATVIIQARIRFIRDTGDAIFVTGTYPAFTDSATTDISILGRDITNQFALIIDRPQDVVCLLGQGHRYTVTAG